MTDIDEYELRKSLEHGTRKERCDAAVALGNAGEDYPMMVAVLSSSFRFVRTLPSKNSWAGSACRACVN